MEKRTYVLKEGDACGGVDARIDECETKSAKEYATLDDINAKLDILLKANGIEVGE